jgi:molybdenum cofactor cytidylyltransferase
VRGVSAILLAAGGGSRFGGGKLLADFGGQPLVLCVLDNLAEAPVDETLVVIGADEGEMRRVCEPYDVRIVENADWEWGQSTSVLAGLHALDEEAQAAVVLLGDQPLVATEAVKRLVTAYEEGARVAVATYGGKRRNPVLFSREVWALLEEEMVGDEGARSVLRRHTELVVEVSCDGVADPADVDTREDLRHLEEMRGSGVGYKMVDR